MVVLNRNFFFYFYWSSILMQQISEGYDHSFVLNKSEGKLWWAAIVHDTESGRKLEIYATEPALHFYTANSLDIKKEKGKEKTAYGRRSALCVELQYFPNSPNQMDFPSTMLFANELWKGKSIFKFDLVRKKIN